MNYWPRFISAIRKRTATLSLMQMGAYDRLLDHYYAEEQPLPSDFIECCRIAGAVTKPEQEAVRSVLAKFFTLGSDGHRNERADEEIIIGRKKIDAAQANGLRGGRPTGSRKKPTGLSSGLPDGLPSGPPTAKAPHPHQTHSEPNGSACAAHATDPPAPEPEAEASSGTEYGRISKAIRQAGVPDAAPHSPRFRALIDAGATAAEFIAFAAKAATTEHPFAYVLGAVEGERKRAAQGAGLLHRGPMPAAVNRQEAIEASNKAVARRWLEEQGVES